MPDADTRKVFQEDPWLIAELAVQGKRVLDEPSVNLNMAKLGRKITGGKYIKRRKKKSYERAGQRNIVKLGDEKRKTKPCHA